MTDSPATNKALGQHWLHDAASLAAVCDGAAVAAGDVVLEIGPGPGSLTQELLSRGALVWAVEFDAELARSLPLRMRTAVGDAADNLQVIQADILRFDFGSLPSGYKIVANIPYYLTSNLLRLLCESTAPFTQASLLVQKEVAQRVCAAPGHMSMLSVSVQMYCAVGLGPLVPARLFTPPPKVDSQILLLDYAGWRAPAVDHGAFFRVVKAGFAERRKKLRSSLSGGLYISKPSVEELLKAAGISPDARAQELSLDDWQRLATVNT